MFPTGPQVPTQESREQSQAKIDQRFAEIAARNPDLAKLTDLAIEAAPQYQEPQAELVGPLGQVGVESASISNTETSPSSLEAPTILRPETLPTKEYAAVIASIGLMILYVRTHASIPLDRK